MDFLQRLGGRKFLMAMIAMGIGTYLELSGHPISAQMAGFLVALVGSFHAANHMTTKTFLASKATQRGSEPDSRIDTLIEKVENVRSADGENVQQFVALLTSIKDSLTQVQGTTGQMGQLVLNVSKDVQAVKKATTQPLQF